VLPRSGDCGQRERISDCVGSVAKNKDCCLGTSGYGQDGRGTLEYAVKTMRSDGVLYGSDFSINDPSTLLARIQNSLL